MLERPLKDLHVCKVVFTWGKSIESSTYTCTRLTEYPHDIYIVGNIELFMKNNLCI